MTTPQWGTIVEKCPNGLAGRRGYSSRQPYWPIMEQIEAVNHSATPDSAPIAPVPLARSSVDAIDRTLYTIPHAMLSPRVAAAAPAAACEGDRPWRPKGTAPFLWRPATKIRESPPAGLPADEITHFTYATFPPKVQIDLRLCRRAQLPSPHRLRATCNTQVDATASLPCCIGAGGSMRKGTGGAPSHAVQVQRDTGKQAAARIRANC